MRKIYILLFFVTLFSINNIFSQGASCGAAAPFCAGGSALTFPNSTTTTTQQDVDYLCLGSQPNPAWFYMQIGLAGNIDFHVSQASNGGTPLDVDVMVWGPFSTPTCGPAGLNGNSIYCSFSAAADEYWTIPNAVVGDIYMVLLTNYSGQVGNITLTQTNTGQPGAGATDCNIICPLSLPNQVICPGGQAILTATIPGATSYQWSSSVSGPIAGNTQSITVTQAGTYTVIVNKPGCISNATTSGTVSFSTPPPINPPVNLSHCSNITNFNLNDAIANIFNGTGLNPADFEVYFHTTAAGAQGVDGSIPNPGAYPGTNGQTVYISVTDNSASSSGCVNVYSFTLTTTPCSATPHVVPNLVLCDDPSNDGIATFDFTPQIPIALDINNPADYTITFHLTQAAADAGTGAIIGINSYNNISNPQTIFIRMEDVTNAATYGTTSFQLIVNTFANAGTDGNTTVCETSVTPINLFSLITGEQTGGTWVRSTGTGGTFNAAAGTFTPAIGATTSTFTYTVTGVLPCVNDTSIATVNINAQPTAGTDGSTTVCENSATAIDLFSLITGEQAGGTWVRSTGTGGIFNAAAGTFTPAVGATTSTFTYTLIGTLPCFNDSSVATVNINAQPTAGTDGGVVICETSVAVINLFNLITGEQAGGTWVRSTGTGGTFNAAAGTFTPAVGATTSTFTYTLIGTLPCINDSSVATITINPQPIAGTDGSTTICETAGAVNLFSLITGEQPGGVWTQNTGTGGTFNAAAGTYTPAVGATSSTFTYTLVGTAPCINDTSLATITINPQPIAGNDGGTTICENNAAVINLNTLITGEQAGGAWTRTTGTGGVFNAVAGTFAPALGVTTSTFTYTLTGTTPCINDTSIATVTVNPLPTATISGTTSVCQNSASPLITFTGSNGTAPYTFNYLDANSAPQTITTISGNSITIPVSTTTAGVYTYQLVSVTSSGILSCSQLQSGSATVTVVLTPTATISGTTAVCQNTASPLITFTGSNGVAPYTFTYLDANSVSQTISTTVGNSVTLPVSTATPGAFTYQLVSVAGAGPTVCSQAQAGSVTITVNPTPSATISGTTAVCLNSASPQILLTGSNGTQPYTFTYSINTVVQPTQQTLGGNTVLLNVPTSAPGTFTYALVSVSDGSSTACSQAVSGSAVVTVNVAPVINTPTDYVVCDDSLNNDGIYCFTLTNKDPEISTDPNVVITYHETLTDSQTGANPKPSPYCNITPGLQTIYVRAYTIGAPLCYSNTSFNLIINPIPLPNPTITDYELCDYNNPGDGVEIFDLVTKSVEIANGQANVTVSYYATLADAQAQTSPLANLYSNTSNPQKIWINIKDNTTGCNTTGSFNLIVNPLPFVTLPQPLFECSNGLVLTAIFDLTINEGVVTSNVTGLTVSYYHSLADAQTETNPIPSPDAYLGTDNEIIYIRVENNNTGCYATTTQLLRVTQGPVALTPQPLQYCDPNNDGFGVFNLNDASNEITGTPPGSPLPPGVSVSYHETPDDAFIGANALTSPYSNIDPWSQIIYVRVFYTLTGCANYVQLKLNVNPTPEATTPQPYVLCDYTGATGYEAFNLTSIIPEILGTIDPTLNTVTFHTTLLDAQNDASPIPNPGNYTNAIPNTQTIYVRVETIATGCYDIVELQLIVNPLPNSTQPNYPQYSLCDNDQTNIGYETFDLGSRVNAILLGQTGMDVTFYVSLGDAQNNTGQITSLMYTNQIQYVQTLGIRITNSLTGCYVISTMDIRVEPLPVLIPPSAPYTLCDDNQDGVTTFDLTSLLPGLLNGITTYTVTFHETITDANSNGTSIPNPTNYVNILPFVQIIFARAEDNITHCVSVIPIELNVDARPIAPILLDNIVVCDDDSNPHDAITGVDLTQRTPDVLAQQPLAAINYTVEYYTSQFLAEQGTLPIINNTSYTGTNGEKIWVRVENNNTSCFNIGSFLLEINTPLLLTTPAPLSLCDDDATPNNQFHVFDLTVKDFEISQGLGTVTYYPSLALAQAGVAGTEIPTPTAYQNVPAHPAVQTLGVVVTTAAGCQSIITLDIRVLPIPTPHTDPPALPPLCDDNNPGDMVEYFNLTQNQIYIGNNDPSLTFHYYLNTTDATLQQNEILTPTAALVGHDVIIRVENNRVDYQGNHCYVLVTQALTVNPLPTVEQPLLPFRACDDNADGFTVFNLADATLTPKVLGALQPTTDFTVTYYLTQAGANPLTNTGETPLPSNFTNTQAVTQTIYIRVTNNATGCVNATGVLDLVVEDYATATSPPDYKLCDEDPNAFDGIIGVDLNQFTTTVLNGQNPAVFLVSYYAVDPTINTTATPLTAAEIADFQAGPITDTVWAMVENSSNSITPYCNAVAPINIFIEPRPNPVISGANGMTTICVDYNSGQVIRDLTLNSGITNPADYTFEWFNTADLTTVIGTGSTYTVGDASAGGAPRDYIVHVTNNFANTQGCDYTSAPFTVIQSGPAVVATGAEPGYIISNAFSDHQTITVNVVGFGIYQYSLNDGPRQVSNVFENVTFDPQIIHVWDMTDGVANSCEELTIAFAQIIDYPHYFTPNGDSIHDNWNITGLSQQRGARIYIFDRYGKLLKQISSTGPGWDGTYNGHLLPADDYWFTVDYLEPSTNQPRQFKAHFTLKR